MAGGPLCSERAGSLLATLPVRRSRLLQPCLCPSGFITASERELLFRGLPGSCSRSSWPSRRRRCLGCRQEAMEAVLVAAGSVVCVGGLLSLLLLADNTLLTRLEASTAASPSTTYQGRAQPRTLPSPLELHTPDQNSTVPPHHQYGSCVPPRESGEDAGLHGQVGDPVRRNLAD